ncbi:Flp family type IVb pilin [Microlunatus capsulatus]|uniref:Pilus assembly protein Flp/PilA n=1 Tax=Microlunatus capsulatus TaxID=99117 RepID=A0ABS4Z4Q0_9ACTN|nr:Flp family type IVb pilin [Microlunatus capsulatus]MBP2416021.1 pilus assembly protein Flp/PilA [Microlunatus capsulatus]
MTGAYAHLIALLTVVSNRFEGRKERGATAVEYGLLVGLIAIVMITGVALVGPKLSTMFTTVAGKL